MKKIILSMAIISGLLVNHSFAYFCKINSSKVYKVKIKPAHGENFRVIKNTLKPKCRRGSRAGIKVHKITISTKHQAENIS